MDGRTQTHETSIFTSGSPLEPVTRATQRSTWNQPNLYRLNRKPTRPDDRHPPAFREWDNSAGNTAHDGSGDLSPGRLRWRSRHSCRGHLSAGNRLVRDGVEHDTVNQTRTGLQQEKYRGGNHCYCHESPLVRV